MCFHEKNWLGQMELLAPCVDNVAAVGSKQGCCEVLAFQCGAIHTATSQCCKTNKCNMLVLQLLRPYSYCVGLKTRRDFECDNKKLQREMSTAGNCSGRGRVRRGQPQEIARVRLIRQDRREVHAMAAKNAECCRTGS